MNPPHPDTIVFIDTEVDPQTEKILDYGAVTSKNIKLHTKSFGKFAAFIQNSQYICGHNILNHDMRYIQKELSQKEPGMGLSQAPIDTPPTDPLPMDAFFTDTLFIDTLCLSPLLFPCRPYHALVKDDKLQVDELNNPLNDAIKAKDLFNDTYQAYDALPKELQRIYFLLLHNTEEFAGFFSYLGSTWDGDAAQLISLYFKEGICAHAGLGAMVQNHPIELAYCLALIAAYDRCSVIPRWVHIHFPYIETAMAKLRSMPCAEGCPYCEKELGIHKRLKSIFGYENFRDYDGDPLQENAVRAAVMQQSLLAVFPTGGGKSLAFQLPALIAGDVSRELTVVISPLQSLMKDQVDNLKKRGITDAVTINGLLSPLERAEVFERIESGHATVLYISPEMLRSKTVERLLLSRSIARFVIDEAHCFSAWGQDFRVDYLYIGDFIRELQEKKGLEGQIPVSCFTATAKQKVIQDIRDYFKNKLGIELLLFATDSTRKNLRYNVIYKETDEEKYAQLRNLIEQKDCPTIVYVSRTKRTWQLAEKLCSDGFAAKPFHGKMETREKLANQEAFIQDEIQVMVATSAFGMGVDKPNVRLVVHYDISDSLENYVQEAGRAGRDGNLLAECYVLFNESDLDKHFILLNQTKLSMNEIQQVWSAVKNMSGNRPVLRRSPLEIARQAGWDETALDIETRVKTAVQALENAGYVRRGKNVPHVYATSILVPNMIEASRRIDQSARMDARAKEYAKRILQMLISKRSIAKAGNDEAESRIDYISDILGIAKPDVIDTVGVLRQEGILADTKDLTAYIRRGPQGRMQNRALNQLNKFVSLEGFLLSCLKEEGESANLKELNEKALTAGIRASSVNAIKTVFYYWTVKNYIKKPLEGAGDRISFVPEIPFGKLREKLRRRAHIAEFITKYLYQQSTEVSGTEAAGTGTYGATAPGIGASGATAPGIGTYGTTAPGIGTSDATAPGMGTYGTTAPGIGTYGMTASGTGAADTGASGKSASGTGTSGTAESAKEEVLVLFSVLELKEGYEKSRNTVATEKDIEDALLYLSKIDAIKLEGGFLVLYNALELKRLEMNNKIRYKLEDYKQLSEFYKQKIQQIHIVGEYAHMMADDGKKALQFVGDYFQMDYRKFLRKYFEGERLAEIERNITPAKYQKLFQDLSEAQRDIIKDNESQYIVVAAGPGSGKTRVLVHKLASLLLLEDVKHEQLLMVTFSRAAATEFKQRLYGLIGNAAAFVEIKTFHSYCFDLLGKLGKPDGMVHVVAEAAELIRSGEAEAGKITKTVVVIDEAQDMDADAAALIYAMMEKNEEMRVIAVGDDDQNIYQFRGSDSKYFHSFIEEKGAVKYDLLENYRSSRTVVGFANVFASHINQRMKDKPIIPVQEENGTVRLIRCYSDNLEQPVVNHILALPPEETTTVCVLTNTNEEALKVFALLLNRGKTAKLIQSNEGFNLYHLAELRYFLQTVKKLGKPPIISDETWEEAKRELQTRYAKSECLPLCLNMLTAFSQVNPRKYLTDLEEFIRESKLEDFYQDYSQDSSQSSCHSQDFRQQKMTVVSTIHKSKGKEFDKVFLLLHHMQLDDDEAKRKLYVGITRAKKELYIYYNSPCLDDISADGIERTQDTTSYPPANEIISHLSHKDIVLGRFKGKQRQMLKLYSGMELDIIAGKDGLYHQRTEVIHYSKKYKDEMQLLNRQGYYPVRAKIRFVLTWKGKDDKAESVILLPEVCYKKRS